jgi:triacylglycerol lipase
MEFDLADVTRRVRALGTEISPESIAGTAAIYAPFHEREPYRAVAVARDLKYGTHERHRLDLFAPESGGAARPVLLYVHGGGFVGGDKRTPGTPYQDNVALWAVRHGLIGINMTYRLAPQHPWPAGAEDVAAAVAWTRREAQRHGGDPARIVLLGTSAGAVHVASYLAHPRFHPAGGPGVAGAALLSGIYDLAEAPRSPMHEAYFGTDVAVYRSASTLGGLIETTVPLLFVVTEMDPAFFQAQAAAVVNAWFARHGRWPRLASLIGHNHLSSTVHLNSPDDVLGAYLLDLFRTAAM